MDGIAITFHIKPERLDAFLAATLDNARVTLREPGTLRFDVLQDQTDPNKVVLIECYATEEAKQEHLASAHFQRWKEATGDVHASDPDFVGGRFLIGHGLETSK